MPRVKRGPKRAAARKRVLKQTEGFFLAKSKLYRAAQEALEKALKYAYTGRRIKKRDFRALWITRINAACRNHDISYSKFMGGLKAAGVDLNRKILSELAIADDEAFGSLVATAKTALASGSKTA
ncbi:MAG: 50S ribosomal protein L20 [Bryobacterales bacterium]|nr:50S ribosomal protein L20 [Bryobacterales bacterium]